MLTLTSIADRTSPVLRGKWVIEVMLGTPPPPPPPNVPDLEETGAVEGRAADGARADGRASRQPGVQSCHRVIDPLGLALENFDVTGQWRDRRTTARRSTRPASCTTAPAIDGLAGLRDVLLQRKDMVLQSFTESLMTYALGRRIEATDMPTVRAIVRDAAAAGLSHDRRSSTASSRARRSRSARRTTPTPAATERQRDSESGRAMFITKKHIIAAHRASGYGRDHGAAAARRDDAGWRGAGAGRAAGKMRLIAIEMVHGAAGSTAFGIEQNLWSPAAIGRASI